MLPSERLRLNASKSESLPVRGDAAGVPPEGGPRQRPLTSYPGGPGRSRRLRTRPPKLAAGSCERNPLRRSRGTPDHLQTTWVWNGVSCPVEQPLRCDLLKLNLPFRGICPHRRRASLPAVDFPEVPARGERACRGLGRTPRRSGPRREGEEAVVGRGSEADDGDGSDRGSGVSQTRNRCCPGSMARWQAPARPASGARKSSQLSAADSTGHSAQRTCDGGYGQGLPE